MESDVLKVRWPHILLLILFLGGGAFVRCYRLGEQGLWLDEYWAVYEATGLGQPGTSVFHKPTGVVLDPPPAVGFVWVGGFWDYGGGHYAWRHGYWGRPGAGYHGWERDRWVHGEHGYVHQRGHWR